MGVEVQTASSVCEINSLACKITLIITASRRQHCNASCYQRKSFETNLLFSFNMRDLQVSILNSLDVCRQRILWSTKYTHYALHIIQHKMQAFTYNSGHKQTRNKGTLTLMYFYYRHEATFWYFHIWLC